MRAGRVVIGRVWECHVTSQPGKLADLAVYYKSCHAVVKMPAKLINCTQEEQHCVILFLWAEGVPGAQVHLCMCAQYGDKVLCRRIVYEWSEMFKNGRTSVTDAERSGRPATATTTRNEERTLEPIRENRRITGRTNTTFSLPATSSTVILLFSRISSVRGCLLILVCTVAKSV